VIGEAQCHIVCPVVGNVEKQFCFMLRANEMCVAQRQLAVLFALCKIPRVRVCGSYTAPRLSVI
jgi:hypothetical protein